MPRSLSRKRAPCSSTSSGRRWPALEKVRLPGRWIEHRQQHGDKFAGGKILHQQAIQASQNFSRTAAGLRQRAQHAAGGGHQQRGRRSLSRNVGQHQAPASIVERNEVVPVSAHGARGNRQPGNREARNVGRTLGQQRLLDGARLASLRGSSAAAHGALAESGAHCVPLLQRDRTSPATSRRCSRREGIQFVMRSRKHAHQPAVHQQRNGHFGERGFFAGDVIRDPGAHRAHSASARWTRRNPPYLPCRPSTAIPCREGCSHGRPPSPTRRALRRAGRWWLPRSRMPLATSSTILVISSSRSRMEVIFCAHFCNLSRCST